MRMKQVKHLLTAALLSSTAMAQLPYSLKKYADSKNAIEIKDSIAGPFNVAYGNGDVIELKNKENVQMQELNSVWFTFTASYDTLLVFDLVPIDSMQDYSFALWKYYSKATMDSIETGHKNPLRINYSYCPAGKSTTGLAANIKVVTTGATGYGQPYRPAFRIKKGDRFYLMVNFSVSHYWDREKVWEVPKGFHLYFYNHYPPKKPVVLKNVLFETNKATLLKSSFAELDKLVTRMQKNKTMHIEIRGHTDNIGKPEDNKILSENRAKAVMDYIVSKGIVAARIQYKGFGDKLPVASNDKEEGRKQNRRVEFAIIMK